MDERAPWWQATKTLRQGYFLTGLWGLMAVAYWIIALLGALEPRWLWWVQVVVATGLTVLYGVSTLRLRRRSS